MTRPSASYFVDRFDNLTRSRRDELLALMPGWEPRSDVPQFFIATDNGPIDWHLLEDRDEAFRDCREFNTPDDSDDLSEAFGLHMMGAI